MQFEWDEQKDRTNFQKHGVSFQQATEIFSGPIVRKIDDRHNYDEDRIIALGRASGRVLRVVFTKRGKKLRIISAKKGDKNDREVYFYYRELHTQRD